MQNIQIEKNPEAKREADYLEYIRRCDSFSADIGRLGSVIAAFKVGTISFLTMLEILHLKAPGVELTASDITSSLALGITSGYGGAIINDVIRNPKFINAKIAAKDIVENRDYSLIANYSRVKRHRINRELERILRRNKTLLESVDPTTRLDNESILNRIRAFEEYLKAKTKIVKQFSNSQLYDIPLVCNGSKAAIEYAVTIDGQVITIENGYLLNDPELTSLATEEVLLKPIDSNIASAEAVIDEDAVTKAQRAYLITRMEALFNYMMAKKNAQEIEGMAVDEIRALVGERANIMEETSKEGHQYTLYNPHK